MKRVATMLGLAVLAALAWLVPAAAQATAPPEFAGGYVIDDTSQAVLGTDQERLESEVREFAAEHGVQLFVVYVDRFSDPNDPEAWGAATAQKNFLGDDGVLLSVAVEDRLFDLNAAQSLISDEQYTRLTNDFVRPALKQSDWTGVVGTTLSGIDQVVLNPASNGTGVAVAVVGGVVVVGGVAAGVLVARKKKRARAAAEGEAAATMQELEAQASGLLVRVDDDVRSSEQELGFAQAQFGAAAAEPFAAAIADARAQLQAAFELRQKLDDDVPDTDEDRRAWLTEIIDRCSGAKASLDEHTESFSRLREVEQRAPEVLAQLGAALPAARTQLDAARATVAGLAASYAESIVGQLQRNLDEADTRLVFVAECLGSAEQEIAAGTPAAAAVTLRAAEAALDQASTLSRSPETTAAELAESARQLDAATADLRADLQTVAQLIGGAAEGDRQALEAAAQQVNAVLAAGTQGDPVRALTAVAAANVQIDAAIGGAREAAERTRRAEAARDEALVPARAEVLAAEQFIETRRGAIGAEARTRLAEAQRQLQLAESYAQSDPARSYQCAQQATQYARAASQLAGSDVNGWGGGGGYGGGGYGGGARSDGSFGGAVLGGILGGLLSGGSGGGSSGGWSGSSGGGGFRGGWGGGSSGGGGGGGGRRGGGGRF
ncbi:TPM domain-containing protein [Leucobacter luti]|uniref:TLP18.3/Psb32/MOLO-1 phosphatase superfamily protein n=1 Tax=Leucobacter luti TaxID=340320 RepID=A0A4Q7U1F5_9MICO|nr:TPM domain-containing protein [Leucobacter luti]MBL3699078.1 TPM domain-containing protein [Leucobacter luti]RZT66580.1 TLP18.3/Psb32/MOLO-1 phosphatase superfamily protein [Leucobacter luti]